MVLSAAEDDHLPLSRGEALNGSVRGEERGWGSGVGVGGGTEGIQGRKEGGKDT